MFSLSTGCHPVSSLNSQHGTERLAGKIQFTSTTATAGSVEFVCFKSRRLSKGVCSTHGGRSILGGTRKIRPASNAFLKSVGNFGIHVEGLGFGCTPKSRSRRRFLDASDRCAAAKSASTAENTGKSNSESVEVEEDPVTKLLRENPSQVEPKYKIGDNFYTLKEKMIVQKSLWKKISLSFSFRRSRESSEVIRKPEVKSEVKASKKDDEVEAGVASVSGADSHPANSIYLSDLLRQYKGNLFIPEEAFEERIAELDGFNRNLGILPQMTLKDFWKFMKADQVKLLTSRGIASLRGGFSYWDFVVDLKEAPGDQRLQRRQWAMHLRQSEAQALLDEYRGSQREVETAFTPYVMRPSRLPHPAASSISARLVTELGVIVSIISALGFAMGGVVINVGLSVFGSGRYVVVQFLWPSVYALLRPPLTLGKNLSGSSWTVVVAVFSGQKGPGWLLAEGYRLWNTGVLISSGRTLGSILFVLIAMAALAKFTLTRRPKDFTKWDLWQAIEFGHSKPQARVEGTTGIGFGDVAGIDDVVKELQELVSYLKDPDRFNRMGTKPPHGVLLEGPPGCGKTLLAKAIAGEAGVPFYQMAGSEFVEVLVGVGAARVRDLFKRAKVNRPSVVFIDEIDALGAIRHGAAGEEGMESYNAGAQERETTLNQLLIELDGFDTGKGVVFLGATNRMDMLDPALLRPGRFDRKIAIRPPRAKGRLEILRVHAKSVKLDDSVDLWVYAKNLPGWSGAELAQLLQEAALVAVRHGGTVIKRHDMDQALDRLTMGPERMGLERQQPIHCRMATHEVGLAITSHLLRRLENAEVEFCDRVSIVPRGETLARTIFDKLDDEAYMFERRPTLIHRMQVMLGGRAAEEVMYGKDTSTFSLQYLPDASWLARKMVSVWNLEGGITIQGDVNPWTQEATFGGPPTGFEGGLYNNYDFNEKILNYDMVDEVANRTKALLDRTYHRTLSMLKLHQAALTKAIHVVMEKEELFGEELDAILDRYPSNMSLQSVEEEAEPRALTPMVETPEIPERQSTEVSSMNIIPPVSSSDKIVDTWVLEVRTNDIGEVESRGPGGHSEGESDSSDARWVGVQTNKSNGIMEGKKRESLDRGESRGNSLEEGDVAATKRSGFGESSPDASIGASAVSLTGKNDVHD